MRSLLPASSPAGAARLSRRTAVAALTVVAVLTVVGVLALVGMRVARSGALPGVRVAELEVGGMSHAQLDSALGTYAERREATPVTVAVDDVRVTGTAADAGYRLDAQATADAVLRRGRQTNPVAALVDHLRSLGGTITVAPVQAVDPDRLEAWVADAAADLSQFPVEGTLQFEGARITRVDPQPGAVVSVEGLSETLRAALLRAEGDIALRAEEESVEPETTAADVDAVLADAQLAVSAPVTLSRNDGTVTFAPDDLGGLLVVARQGPDLRLEVDAQRLEDAIGPATVEAFEADAVDATFSVAGGAVSLQPSSEGFRFDPQVAADQMAALLTTAGPREATLEGQVVEPDLTTAEAGELRIVERVSTFTTAFTAGQSRVTNIQRIADLVDGVLIEPGETFSVNGHVGERTTAKGFVGGGAIFDGEFVEQIGGGVSQFATTLYNAAYFGGYDIAEHKAHSYYISRYPVGREATLNYPNVDLKIRNTSPHGALVKTAHTSTSVTVSFYGTRWVEVDTVAEEPTNVVPPSVEVRETTELGPGEERVVREGRQGFDITVTRVLQFPDGRVEREREFTRYLPEPRIVERGAPTEPPPPPE